jgi:hypothetical protein
MEFSEVFRKSHAILKTFPCFIEEYRRIAWGIHTKLKLNRVRGRGFGGFMSRKGIARIATSMALACVLGTFNVWAQCPVSVAAAGLQAPTKIFAASGGNLLIAEAGFGPNMGRISVLNSATGDLWTFIDGLPSGFSPPNGDPSGPSSLGLQGNTLFVTIGLGDAIINGPVPGTQVANPAASSQLFSSVLAIDLGRKGTDFHGGYNLTLADQATLVSDHSVILHNSAGEAITVRLVANFPDYLPEPVPGVPDNVRQSNPFGIAIVDDLLYVPDASSNSLRYVNSGTGAFGTLTDFAPLPNTRGFGPPAVEAVPNAVRRFGDNLLITLLSGFPFPIGGSEVRVVDPAGHQATLISGLTAAIDVLPLKQKGNQSFLTLESVPICWRNRNRSRGGSASTHPVPRTRWS